MRHVIDKLSDIFNDISKRKKEAAFARSLSKDISVESPREVYSEACQRIAHEFSHDGFKYSKSGPHFTKSEGYFSYKISFQSSYHNIPGKHVRLWMHANVYSQKLKKWRANQSNPCRTDDWVAGGMVHLLTGKHAMIEWELAKSHEREAVISNIKKFIREEVLSYFHRFTDPSEVISSLAIRELSAFELSSSIEFALCFGNHEQAQQVLNRFVNNRSDLLDKIEIATEFLRKSGFPKHGPSSYAETVAWVRSVYNLS